MSASHEWWEYHLTPDGWIEGSNQLDFGNVTKNPTPDTRVATYRHTEKLSSIHSEMATSWKCIWASDDKGEINRLLELYGDDPH